jgi:hypothetical protein
MIRIVLAVIAGFFTWLFEWSGLEKILSALWPEWYGAHQLAFEAALLIGSPFTPDSTILVIHILCASIASWISGFLAARIAGERKRAPQILSLLLLALGLAKMTMSWPLVPIWYHLAFTAVLIPMTIIGGNVTANSQTKR